MSLKDTFSKAAQTGATIFNSVFKDAVYYGEASSVYNASSGAVSAIVSSEAISILLSNYKAREIDGERVLPTDLKGMIPQANINSTPALNDHIQVVESGASVTYEIINIMEDAAEATWVFQLRKP